MNILCAVSRSSPAHMMRAFEGGFRYLMLVFLVRAVSAWWGGEPPPQQEWPSPSGSGALVSHASQVTTSPDRCFSTSEVREAVEHEVSARDVEIAKLRLACARCPSGADDGSEFPSEHMLAKVVHTDRGGAQKTGTASEGECAQGVTSALKAELDLLRNILNEMQLEREEMAQVLAAKALEVDKLKQRLERLGGRTEPSITAPEQTSTPVLDASRGAGGAGHVEGGLFAEIWQNGEITAGEEDKEGQTMWVYGTVAEGEGEAEAGGRYIVIELGSNNGQWIASFLEEKRANGIGV